ncbi:Na+/H+ antiporter family protein [Halanaerobacter jeridensis]|uniref:Histidine transporter YuiF (NhaC family) n=1 Tax=Halanaerobacter jeridensis TaxID=706427 RepID=A0A939BPN9_9FIRM|nr:Na+/H+ antiporter NhaC family protein [Halanaerobacter jeridensis]MBM7555414.1 putative histidine transporter YuiF (NhaC family) [Halanaerobacter jeridensis]
MNPVLVSVSTMIILSLANLNVILALLVAAIAGGLTGGLTLTKTMNTLINGMGGNAETALSYILLGALAVAVQKTGIVHLLSSKLSKLIKDKKKLFVLLIGAFACLSQNLIPVHIAFIPILIPPLLELFNKLKIDRRAVASALTFGLQAPYMAIPAGFGLIFHKIIRDEMSANGMDVSLGQISSVIWIPVLGMLLGLLVAIFITYNQDREYDAEALEGEVDSVNHDVEWNIEHIFSLLALLAALAIQLTIDSLPLGALVGLGIMVVTGSVDWHKLHDLIDDGVKMMGVIAFVMLIAAGYGDVIRATGGVQSIVQSVDALIGGSQLIGGILMLIVGLLVTMGIGTSFGTIPIIAAIYVPLAQALGFSPLATIILIGTAGALGDAGSPASDSTLGPTAGLNADGQHDHIWDTCVPTFLHYNIPLILFAWLGALIL